MVRLFVNRIGPQGAGAPAGGRHQEGGVVLRAARVAGVPRDHAAGEGGQGERGAPAEREEAGVPEAERQVHRQGAQGRKDVDGFT